MKKKLAVVLSSAVLLSTTAAFADPYPNRPANATGHAPAVHAKLDSASTSSTFLTTNDRSISPNTLGYWQVDYVEPSTITVAIYTLDSNGNEGTYQKNVTVDFETYVKDVLPNEWYESWGTTAMNSLYAGALAVKTFAWYHCIAWKKDEAHNANVTNGVLSQVYKQGSNKPNCNAAVSDMANDVIADSNGNIYETGYRDYHTNDGYIMSQHGTYDDALAGKGFSDIIRKWYSAYGADVEAEKYFIPY